MKKIKYVVGFMFSNDLNYVALIRKGRPTLQKGKLNGIGGHIENGETGFETMVREFKEETGYGTDEKIWKYFAIMKGINEDGTGFECKCYASTGDLSMIHTMDESEPVIETPVRSLFNKQSMMIENIPWLVNLAKDHLEDGRPTFVTVDYSSLVKQLKEV